MRQHLWIALSEGHLMNILAAISSVLLVLEWDSDARWVLGMCAGGFWLIGSLLSWRAAEMITARLKSICPIDQNPST